MGAAWSTGSIGPWEEPRHDVPGAKRET
jgi:hypothetical protein